MIPTDLPLVQVLNDSYQLRVPIFQRRYKWTATQHERLWTSIVRQMDVKPSAPLHFMGAVVLTDDEPGKHGARSYRLVIDGQQRLLTMQILLSVMASCASGSLRTEIQRNYLTFENARSVDQTFRVVPGPDDAAPMELCVLLSEEPFPRDSHLVARAWWFYDDAVAKLVGKKPANPALRRLLRTIKDRLRVVQILTDPHSNAQEIFETLNNDGLRLEQVDLIRNFVFMTIGKRADDIYSTNWAPMERSLPDKRLEDFFLAWAISHPQARRVRPRVGAFERKSLFLAVRTLLSESGTSAEAMTTAVRHLQKEAELFASSELPRFQRSRAARTADHICTETLEFGSERVEPLVHFVRRLAEAGEISPADFLASAHAINSFVVRWILSGDNQSPMTSFFRTMMLSQTFDARARPLSLAIRAYLRNSSHPVSDKAIRDRLVGADFYLPGRNADQYRILRRLTYAVQGERTRGTLVQNAFDPRLEDPALERSTWDLDHIAPRELKEWKSDLKRWRIARDAMELRLDRIGNLAPLARNRIDRHDGWADKRQSYGGTSTRLHQEVARKQRWTPVEIDARSKRLAKLALQLWPAP